MRLFVALDFSPLKEYFEELQAQIPKDAARLRFPKEFHLTLKFLGDIEGHKIEHIQTALHGIRFKPMTCALSEVGVFKDWERITVAWVGLKDNGSIKQLQEQVDGFLSPWLPKSDRFHAHITLARVKNVKDKPKLVEALKKLFVEPRIITIHTFHLIASELTPEGPKYEIIETYGKEPVQD
ncbi:MAG: RNA 2',3'-cyclic phosphodiesterase [Candidatus Nanoarchaeia archaeon]